MKFIWCEWIGVCTQSHSIFFLILYDIQPQQYATIFDIDNIYIYIRTCTMFNVYNVHKHKFY